MRERSLSSAAIARLALVTDREDFDPFGASPCAIERDVAAPAVRDHQLAQVLPHRTSDQRVAFEDPDGFDDQCAGLRGSRRIARREEVEQAVQVRESPLAVNDLRQAVRY